MRRIGHALLCATLTSCGGGASSSDVDAGGAPESPRELRRRLHTERPAEMAKEPTNARFRVPTPIAATSDRAGTFVMRRRESSTFFTPEGLVFSLRDGTRAWSLRAALVGAKPSAPLGELESSAKVNDYAGGKTSARTQAPSYGQLAWEEVYPGIDMVAEPSTNGIEYRFVLSPGARLSDLAMRWDGANDVRIVEEGRGLDVETDIGVLRVRGLRAFSIERGQRVELPTRHVRRGDAIGLEVDGWDGRTPLVIDPNIAWSSYLGGSRPDNGGALAVAPNGDAVIAGQTSSADVPTSTGLMPYGGMNDAFIAKVSASGALQWATYLGGTEDDGARGVAIDAAGNIFVGGYTYSLTFPAVAAFDSALIGAPEGFVTKLTTSGTISWSSFLGGSDTEFVNGVAVDSIGNVLIGGQTRSADFPVPGGFDTTFGGTEDAFVTKISSGGAVIWSSFLGGASGDYAEAIAVDGSGDVVIAGATQSSAFPTVAAFDTTAGGGGFDAFVAKFSAAGGLVYSSYLGGSGVDEAFSIAVDTSGNAYVLGKSDSSNFPTTGGFDTTYSGNDGFLTKVSPSGALVWSSFLGTPFPRGVAVDTTGDVFVAGSIGSDAFLRRISGAPAPIWNHPFGGTGIDGAFCVAIDNSGNAYVAGQTSSTDYPVSGGFDTTYGGTIDAFLTKFTFGALGAACTDLSQCAASRCVDGVCCDSACTGRCFACSAAKKGAGADGTCGVIADGTDPDKECTAASCSAGVVTKARLCDGAGACRSDGTLSCGLYTSCVGAACATTCTTDANCVATAFCSGTACTPDLDLGAACVRSSQCKSGTCVDGVCCDTPCTGPCQACTAAAKGSGIDGVCGNVAVDTDPRNRCAADSMPLSCGPDGMCDGTGACRPYAKSGTACGTTTCVAGIVSNKKCNGLGLCETLPSACSPYTCGTDACKTTCASDLDCAADAYCTSTNTCVLKVRTGSPCTDGRECERGFCVDSVCCESACAGQCEACGETGTVGKCVAVAGAPRGKRTACAGDPTICGGACDGTNTSACKLAPPTKSCGSTCAAGQETTSKCDGTGACAAATPRSCAPFACADDKTCATTCTTDSQCAAGLRCEAGNCVTPPKAGTCATAADCQPGLACTGGVCSPAPAAPADEGGCGCETGPRAGRAWPALLALGVVLAARRRRSSTR